MRLILDTNIVIGLLVGAETPTKAFHAAGVPIGECAVSFVTRLEVLGWPGMTEEAERTAREFLNGLRTLPFDDEIEQAAIALRRRRKIKLPDALILAAAQVHAVPLLSLDRDLLVALNGLP